MRRSLGDQIDYFEADLTAFTSIRRLMEVAESSSPSPDRPVWASEVDSEPQPWKPTPVEVETIPASSVAPAPGTNASAPAAANATTTNTTTATKPTAAGNATAHSPAPVPAGSPAPVPGNISEGQLVASIQPYYEDYVATIQPYPDAAAEGEHCCSFGARLLHY